MGGRRQSGRQAWRRRALLRRFVGGRRHFPTTGLTTTRVFAMCNADSSGKDTRRSEASQRHAGQYSRCSEDTWAGEDASHRNADSEMSTFITSTDTPLFGTSILSMSWSHVASCGPTSLMTTASARTPLERSCLSMSRIISMATEDHGNSLADGRGSDAGSVWRCPANFSQQMQGADSSPPQQPIPPQWRIRIRMEQRIPTGSPKRSPVQSGHALLGRELGMESSSSRRKIGPRTRTMVEGSGEGLFQGPRHPGPHNGQIASASGKRNLPGDTTGTFSKQQEVEDSARDRKDEAQPEPAPNLYLGKALGVESQIGQSNGGQQSDQGCIGG